MTTSTLSYVHRLVAVVLIGALGFLAACDDDDDGMVDPPIEDDGTIADIVGDDDSFSTLLGLLQGEGLTDALGDEDATFTVFAPTNAAFGPYDLDAIAGTEGAVGEILRYHVVQGAAVAAGDLTDGQTIETLAGDELTVSLRDGNVFIDGAQVTQPDVEADNGIIHVIDRTLVGNQNLANVAAFVNETTALFDAVAGAGLGEAFADAEQWTVFGPNNATFENADLSGFTEEEIAQILQYHVVAGSATTSTALLDLLAEGEVTLTTLQGEDLTIALDGDQVVFNDGQATLDVANLDYFASNGILHVIDGLLLPPSLAPATTIADVVAGDENFSTLLAALQAADLVDPLANEESTFTVFAPNNDGFAPINTDVLLAQPALSEVLGYHVIPDAEIAAADLSEGDNPVTTLAGEELTVVVNDDGVFIEGSEVVSFDIEADNGIIHVLDRTLLGNQNLANVVQFTAETEELFGAVGNAGLADAFVNADDWTVFGPNNATFENADLSGFSDAEIAEVLQYHVFPDGITSSGDLLQLLSDNGGEVTIPTLQGEDLTIAQDGEEIVFNDSDDGPQATLDLNNLDYFGSNGILHVIDGLLLPPSLTATAIADARALPDDEVVTIEGVLTRGKGRYLFFQDDTAGIMLFDFAGFNDELDSGDLAIGDLVRVNGRMDTFNDQRQLRIDDDAFSISVISSGNALPEIPTITLDELNSNPEAYIHQLVRVESFTIDPDGDTAFDAGGADGNYTIDDGTDTGVLRLEGSNSSEYEGEPIPSGPVTFEGAVSRFQSTYQLHLALESDLTVD
ncbi:MAG: hypothetical protein GVY15_13415 [Bacteroidetes bacterium]|jgi:uncharacterized surface protein with fasciclin (FAS1) repeats|nr:hypothetical protein [Bacteroidota bacterium]